MKINTQPVRNPVRNAQSLPRAGSLESTADSTAQHGFLTTAVRSGNGALLNTLDTNARRQAFSGENDTVKTDEQATKADIGDSAIQIGTATEARIAVINSIITDSTGIIATESAIANDTAGLEAVKSTVQSNFSEVASSAGGFHEIMKQSFGDNYDQHTAETIRQQVLANDFSWMPEIKVVDQAVLQNISSSQGDGEGLGAYSKSTDTIYLNAQLVASDPDTATQILTEEVGHGLDVRLNVMDTAGDEGDVFARLMGGEKISQSDFTALQVENDNGVIVIDNVEVEVEFGLGSFFKGLFKGVGNFFSDIGKKFGDLVVKGVKFLGSVGEKVAKTFLEHVVEPVREAAKDLLELAKEISMWPFEYVKEAKDNMQDFFKAALDGDWKGARKALGRTVEHLITTPAERFVETFVSLLHTGIKFIESATGQTMQRKLSSTEKSELRDVFGNSVNLSKITIITGGIRDSRTDSAHVIGNDIFMPDKYFDRDSSGSLTTTLSSEGKSVLVHEVAHVWQYQKYGTEYISDSIYHQHSQGDGHVGSGEAYDWVVAAEAGTRFKDMGAERQAELIQYVGKAMHPDTKRVDGDMLNAALTKDFFTDDERNTDPTLKYSLSPVAWEIFQEAARLIKQ